MLGLTTKVTSGPLNSVDPSGAVLATCSAASWLWAPGLFSTITCWPQASVRRCASTRPSASVTPPGAAGTTMVIGRAGQFCAEAVTAAPRQSAANKARLRVQSIMGSLPALTVGAKDCTGGGG